LFNIPQNYCLSPICICAMRVSPNVVAYCRSCCIPTLYQREQRRENTQNLSTRGKAAILAICSLHVSGCHSRFLYFQPELSIFHHFSEQAPMTFTKCVRARSKRMAFSHSLTVRFAMRCELASMASQTWQSDHDYSFNAFLCSFFILSLSPNYAHADNTMLNIL
jgi:hypothetical protein